MSSFKTSLPTSISTENRRPLTRDNVKDCVITVFEAALREHFRYPKKNVSPEYITSIAEKLELAAYENSKITNNGIEIVDINGQRSFAEQPSSEDAFSDEMTYEIYISDAARLLIHISPSFYMGRHSFYFSDMIESTKIPSDLLSLDLEEFLPEIFSDYSYLNKEEIESIMITRAIEHNIAVKGLVTFIDQCCAHNTCTHDEKVQALLDGGVFAEGTVFTQSMNQICFGSGDTCSQKGSGKIVLPCDENTEQCMIIPEEAKRKYNSVDSYKYFSTCMMYRDFLKVFAEENMEGRVINPTNGKSYLGDNTAENIRKKHRKEIKIMLHYLDMKRGGGINF